MDEDFKPLPFEKTKADYQEEELNHRVQLMQYQYEASKKSLEQQMDRIEKDRKEREKYEAIVQAQWESTLQFKTMRLAANLRDTFYRTVEPPVRAVIMISSNVLDRLNSFFSE